MEDYKEYMRVSNTIPSEVYDLTAEIVGDNDTVIEKASSIRNYLSENYPYTLKVSNVPMNEDFVSYFLFKEKKTVYCTYFASCNHHYVQNCWNTSIGMLEGFKQRHTILIKMVNIL